MTVNIAQQLERLIQYGLQKKLISKWDIDYSRNLLLHALQLDEAEMVKVKREKLESPTLILKEILDWAAENGRLKENTITYRDLLDTKLMGCLTPRPAEVVQTFNRTYEEKGARAATEAFIGCRGMLIIFVPIASPKTSIG